MRDPLIAAVIFNFLALVVVAVLWSAESRRGDRLAYEMACLRYDLGLPEPLPEPRWWERAREWLRTVPEEDDVAIEELAGHDGDSVQKEPGVATTGPIPVTTDTQPSEAIVIGGARVVGKTAPSRAADWVEDDLAAIRARTAKRISEGVR